MRKYVVVGKDVHPFIRALHREGVTYEVIARSLGCSRSRVAQICRGEVAKKSAAGNWTVGKANADAGTDDGTPINSGTGLPERPAEAG